MKKNVNLKRETCFSVNGVKLYEEADVHITSIKGGIKIKGQRRITDGNGKDIVLFSAKPESGILEFLD